MKTFGKVLMVLCIGAFVGSLFTQNPTAIVGAGLCVAAVFSALISSRKGGRA